jgi:hypothetical protein
MVLIWSDFHDLKSKPMAPTSQRQQFLAYPETLCEVHKALKDGYGIVNVRDSEFTHQIVFLKYDSEKKTLHTLAISGTKEEINQLQEDEIVKRSLLQR